MKDPYDVIDHLSPTDALVILSFATTLGRHSLSKKQA
jgi:hypothetical protein